MSRAFRFLVLACTCALAPLSAQSLPDIATFPLGATTPPPTVTGSPPFSVGDLDLDGKPEIAVPVDEQNWQIRSGADGSLQFTVATPFTTQPASSRLVEMDDLDGDGRPDLVALDATPGQQTINASQMRAISGADGSTIWFQPGVLSANGFDFRSFSSRFHPIGDQNGDGVRDLVLLVLTRLQPPGFPPPGTTVALIEVRSGADGSLLHAFSASGGNAAQHLEPVGDLDGDNVEDFVLGAPGVSSNSFSEGAVAIVRGGTYDYLQFIVGAQPLQRFGNGVAGVGDVDGDGVADFGVFSDGGDQPSAPGTVSTPLYEVYSGATFANIVRAEFSTGLALSRYRGAPAVDLTGDGIKDLPLINGLVSVAGFRVLDGRRGDEIAMISSTSGLVEDTSGDGIGEIVDWRVAPGLGGELHLSTLIGAQAFGAGNGATLLRWAPLAQTPRIGSVVIEGATPVSPVVIGVSGGLSPLAGPTPLLIDPSPANLIDVITVASDATGRFAAGLELAFPPLAGTVVYVQALDTSTSTFSNGLELLFED